VFSNRHLGGAGRAFFFWFLIGFLGYFFVLFLGFWVVVLVSFLQVFRAFFCVLLWICCFLSVFERFMVGFLSFYRQRRIFFAPLFLSPLLRGLCF
jgi:hypothetical protein